MKLNLLFFGALTDITLTTGLILNVTGIQTVEELDVFVCRKYPLLIEKQYKIALNQKLAAPQDLLKDCDELAFLPPFAGG